MSASFYEPDGELFASTRHTVGPWDPASQHGGPPAALLGRQIERCEPREGWRVARITCEILRPVPIVPLRVAARIARPGRSVDLVEAELAAGDGTPLMRASAWRMRTAGIGVERSPESGTHPPPPEDGEEPARFWDTAPEGYLQAMEWRFTGGSVLAEGAASAWLRMRIPLLPGEEPTPLARVLCAADSGNGIGGSLDPARYLFVNTELTVHLHRPPRGVWVHLDATTTVARDGIGLTETALWDEHGRIGRAAQSLLIAAREG